MIDVGSVIKGLDPTKNDILEPSNVSLKPTLILHFHVSSDKIRSETNTT